MAGSSQVTVDPAANELVDVDLRSRPHDDVLVHIERSLSTELDRSRVVYGSSGMTAGFPTVTGRWVRVQWRRSWKINGPAWTGAECASVLRGVVKPAWFQTVSWIDTSRGVAWRADEMELVGSPAIGATGIVAADPELPESWWTSLKTSLSALAEHETERVGMAQAHLTRRINQVFPDAVDTVIDEWTTAHADLHWGNLTEDCHILDWEDWGAGPRGYDASTLWGSSLRVSSLAARVQREFRSDLQSRSGRLAQLLFCSNVIRVNATRPDPSPLVEPAKTAAAELIAALRA